MSGRKSRRKGAQFERDIANAVRSVFPESKRGIGQARSAGEVADVEGTPCWFECKRWKKCNISAAMQQAQEATDGRPCVVVTKDDYSPTLVNIEEMTLEKFVEWIEAIQKVTNPKQS